MEQVSQTPGNSSDFLGYVDNFQSVNIDLDRR